MATTQEAARYLAGRLKKAPTKTQQSPHTIEARIRTAIAVYHLSYGDIDTINEAITRIHDLAQERDELEAKLAAVREAIE